MGEGRRNDIGPFAELDGFGLLWVGIAAGTQKRRYGMGALSYRRAVKVLMPLAWLFTIACGGSSSDGDDD